MNITNSCIKSYLSFFHLAVLNLYQLNRSDMLNARKIQEFVMFISRLFPRNPEKFFARSSMSIIYLWVNHFGHCENVFLPFTQMMSLLLVTQGNFK